MGYGSVDYGETLFFMDYVLGLMGLCSVNTCMGSFCHQ